MEPRRRVKSRRVYNTSVIRSPDCDFSRRGEVGAEAVFPEPNKRDKSCLDLACKLPFKEGASGSSRCPPRAKLDCFRADRFLPSERRGSRRDMVLLDGGLLSSTIKTERSLVVGGKRVACKGKVCFSLTGGFSPGEVWESFSCNGGACVGGSVVFAPGKM